MEFIIIQMYKSMILKLVSSTNVISSWFQFSSYYRFRPVSGFIAPQPKLSVQIFATLGLKIARKAPTLAFTAPECLPRIPTRILTGKYKTTFCCKNSLENYFRKFQENPSKNSYDEVFSHFFIHFSRDSYKNSSRSNFMKSIRSSMNS